MSDFFREVDEDVRRDRILNLWAKYRNFLISLAVLVVVGTAAWHYYDYARDKNAATAGSKYEAAVELARKGKSSEAAAAFDALSKTAPQGYVSLARLRAAAERAASDPRGAIAAFDELAASPSTEQSLRDLATVRAAMLRVDSDDPLDFERKYAPLASSAFAYRHEIEELIGLAALKRNDLESAKRSFEAIAADTHAAPGLRTRAEALLSLVNAALPSGADQTASKRSEEAAHEAAAQQEAGSHEYGTAHESEPHEHATAQENEPHEHTGHGETAHEEAAHK